MNVLFCASECSPFVKIGGIADVIGSLPLALNKNPNLKVSVVIPLYKEILKKIKNNELVVRELQKSVINYNSKPYEIRIYKHEGVVDTYFIYNPDFISNGGVYYDPMFMKSFDDETTRFILFSKAITSLFVNKNSPFYPNVLHCHDWHTGLIPQLIENKFRFKARNRPKTIFTIHNLGYQGFTALDVARKLDLNLIDDKTLRWDAQDDNLDMLLQGVVGANYITTVSPNYAKEIQTKEYGEGLDEILKSREANLKGVLNGISYEVFNPENDNHLYSKYNLNSYQAGKLNNKLQFAKDYNLDPDLPIISIVSRLVHQKGIDLVALSIDKIIKLGFTVIILGTGDKELEHILSSYNHNPEYNTRYKAFIKFSNELAMKIYAASDFLLIPSRYEPCGLTQMIAMKYGTLPVVRATGGLEDTVIDQIDGIKFKSPTLDGMLDAISKSHKLFTNKVALDKCIQNAMQKDFSWDRSALEYSSLYNDT